MGMYGMPPQGMPPLMHPPPPHLRPGSRAVEEPIYMPHNARPLSPVASYQPGHFPHEAYYNQQQYATIDKANKHRGKSKKNNRDPHGDPQPPMGSSDSNAEESEFGAGIFQSPKIQSAGWSYWI